MHIRIKVYAGMCLVYRTKRQIEAKQKNVKC
jgi:hypothetical protein